MTLSRQVEEFRASEIVRMSSLCKEKNGINLAEGFPDFAAPNEVKKAAIKAIRNDQNQYSISHGRRRLRKDIARKVETYNGIHASPKKNITVTCGSTEAMIASLMSIINQGDEVIIFEPSYETYVPGAQLAGANVRFIELKPPNWTYSFKELEDTFNKSTKAILINSPHNPTGKVFSKEELNHIAKLCKKWDSFAISDEIYQHLLYDEAEHISIASLDSMKDRSITISSLSKTYSVTGWRVGWAIASQSITEHIRRIHDVFTAGAPSPLQDAGSTCLALSQQYYNKLQSKYAERKDFLYDLLSRYDFETYKPEGAYYIFAGIDDLMNRLGVQNSIEFSNKFLEITGVGSVPGSTFYFSSDGGDTLVRFCFSKKMETLRKAREQFESNLQ